MKINIYDKNNDYCINLMEITQLCGLNFFLKDFILDSINKFFSNKKYMEYEDRFENNIKIENEEVGRNYFKSIRISKRQDIIDFLKLNKTSPLKEFMDFKTENIHVQRQLNIIDDALEEIYLNLNSDIFKNINITYKREDLLSIIQKSVVKTKEEKDIESLETKELLNDFIILIENIQKINPEKLLISIENIEHFLTKDEYNTFYYKLKNLTYHFDIWFIIPLSIDGYVIIEDEYINGINIINDIILPLENMERLSVFIKDNYPYYKNWQEEELKKSIQQIIHKIGKEEEYYIKSNIILKIFNDTLCVAAKEKQELNTLENNFLFNENMV